MLAGFVRYVLVLALGAVATFSAPALAQENPLAPSQSYIFRDGRFYAVQTVPTAPQPVDLPELRFSDPGALASHPFPVVSGRYDLALYLIENDMARLVDPSTASPALQEADRRAEGRRVELEKAQDAAEIARQEQEAKDAEIRQKESEKLWKDIESGFAAFGSFIVDWWPALVGGSFLVFLYRLSRLRFVRIITAGQVASGKTSVLMRLTSETITEEEIRKIDPTANTTVFDDIQKIPAGGLTYRARIIDVAGSRPGANLAFSGRPRWWIPLFDFWVFDVLLVVLAPAFKLSASSIDADAIKNQEGYVDGLVTGLIQHYGGRRLRVVQVFVNKADLSLRETRYLA